MASSSNPVSPKVVAAGWGSVIGPVLLMILELLVNLGDYFITGDGQFLTQDLPVQARLAINTAASLAGAVLLAYRKTDGLRLPTLDQAEVDRLNETEYDDDLDPIE